MDLHRPIPQMTLIDHLSGTPTKQYAAGRRCRWPRCTTILSTYNPGPLCAVHAHGDTRGHLPPTPHPSPRSGESASAGPGRKENL